MAELIKLSFGMVTRVLDGRAHWRHLANMVEQLCVAVMNIVNINKGGNAAYSQIPATYDQTFVQVHDGDPSLQNWRLWNAEWTEPD